MLIISKIAKVDMTNKMTVAFDVSKRKLNLKRAVFLPVPYSRGGTFGDSAAHGVRLGGLYYIGKAAGSPE